MRTKTWQRRGNTIHLLLGVLAGFALVAGVATALQVRLHQDRTQAEMIAAEIQHQQELTEANRRQVAELQTKANNLEAEIAAANKNDGLEMSDIEKNTAELKKLMDEVEEMKKQFPKPTPRVPTIDRSGKVEAIADNIAVINLGSADGIEAGDILQVYRTTPTPTYLGTLEIGRAESHRSVGEFKPVRKHSQITVGDQVNTKIQ